MSIEIRNVTKRFGDTTALDNVSVTLEGNRIYGLLGNNGAGKTTLLGIMTDRLLPTSGQVLLDGEDVRGNDSALGRIFLVGEQDMFPDDMRVRRAVKVAGDFYPDFDREYAAAVAERFGLDMKKKISSLSTGYASIFRLTLGLAANTPYLFFDEPVLGLDAQHRDLFYKLLMEKCAETPCTVILSTHLIAEAAKLVEHTVIIRNGHILKNAPTEELTAKAFCVSGPAGIVDAYIEGRHVLTVSTLGGLKTACLEGEGSALPEGLERSPLNLQDYFISLMEEEDKK